MEYSTSIIAEETNAPTLIREEDVPPGVPVVVNAGYCTIIYGRRGGITRPFIERK